MLHSPFVLGKENQERQSVKYHPNLGSKTSAAEIHKYTFHKYFICPSDEQQAAVPEVTLSLEKGN